jgi:L-2-hydroxyglutarate oxidase
MNVSHNTVIIIGAGIVGLATAMQLQKIRPNLKLIILEKEQQIALHQTGNNSGVIHSGLYYKPGSLKARNCLAGYQELLDFCEQEAIPVDICGKLVVATHKNEIGRLEELYQRGCANGLNDLKFLGPDEIKELEPFCSGVQALSVPQTGIVDYSLVASHFLKKLKENGAEVHFGVNVCKIKHATGDIVEVSSLEDAWQTQAVVVCAGLHSDRLALQTLPELPLRILPFRGEYYRLKANASHLVNNLIYPVPDPSIPFLGVHFTRMIGGGVECGPNAVLAFGREAYRKTDFNIQDTWETLTWPGFRKLAYRYWRQGIGEYNRSLRKSAFVEALQKLIPDICSDHLEEGGAGVRAQACDKEGKLLDDFEIKIDKKIVYVCNAPSPAASASLAIGQVLANHVVSLLN